MGDGWSVLVGEKVEAVAICGLGGKSLSRIIDQIPDNLSVFPSLVLGAHTCLPLVRDALQKKGYSPRSEQIVYSNRRYYHLIWANHDGRLLTDRERLIGRNLCAESPDVLINYFTLASSS